MYLPTVVGTTFAVLTVTLLLTEAYIERKKQRQRQRRTLTAPRLYRNTTDPSPDIEDARAEAAEQEAATYEAGRAAMFAWLEEVRSTEDPDKRFALLVASQRKRIREYLGEEDTVWCADELASATWQRTRTLLEAARQGDADAFLELHRLVTTRTAGERHRRKKSFFQRYTAGEQYAVPEDWNDLVAQLIREPELNLFEIEETLPPSGELVRLAQEAIKTRDLTEAKIVLSIYRTQPHLRRGAPIDDLAELIDELHAEQGLFPSGPRIGIVPKPRART